MASQVGYRRASVVGGDCDSLLIIYLVYVVSVVGLFRGSLGTTLLLHLSLGRHCQSVTHSMLSLRGLGSRKLLCGWHAFGSCVG